MKSRKRLIFLFIVFILMTCNTNALGLSAIVTLLDVDSNSTSPTGQYRWIDVNDQLYAEEYRTTYNYAQANVQVTYSVDANTLHGVLSAMNLKPNFAYQFKLC